MPDELLLPGQRGAAGQVPAAAMPGTRHLGAAVGLATGGAAALICAEMYVAGGSGLRGTGLVLSYLSGMTMVALPCTLPMVFVIVPLVLGRSVRTGIGMALAFGAGVSVTLAAYGAVVAMAGRYVGITAATQGMWLVGGLAAYVFGLAQLRLIPWRLPAYRGPLPRFLAGRAGVGQAFGVGLLLGNAGVGCPCPPWYLLLGAVATSGSPAYGAAIGFAQGLGRLTPILAVAVAAVFGVNWSRSLARRQRPIEAGTGAILVLLGAMITVFMALAHPWFEATPFHVGWNHLLTLLGGTQISEVDPGGGPSPPGLWWAPWLFACLLLVPAGAIAVRVLRRRSRATRPSPELP
ncbi:MAG TPA: cytochrome c biogenesis protein CcdA [Trebonia sp.]|nr:cytochrome c biogenesis protein CcdA [Trebonia sp.]